ncbi:MAG: alpha/beta fold hydrolase [Myxococcota bacterium]
MDLGSAARHCALAVAALHGFVASVAAPASGAPAPRTVSAHAVAREPASRGAVVLLHGLGRSARAMAWLERRLARAGYATHAVGYASVTRPFDAIVDDVDREIARCCADAERVHFVTHSLGGLVLRAWAARANDARIGRVVMLGPPSAGSAIVDRLGALRAVLGPTGRELGTGEDALPGRLARAGPVPFELGVIAGDRSWNPIGSWMLEGPDDGAVAVASARVDGMRDFVVLPAAHTALPYARDVAAQAIHFLDHGRFDRRRAERAPRGGAGAR